MKFSCEKLPLLIAIVTASRAAATKSPVPLLEGLLIEAEEGVVRISGYDLKTGIVTKLSADVGSTGGIVLNARLFGDIIRKMPGHDITITVNSGFVATISCEMSEFEILGSPISDYPELPAIDGSDSIEIGESLLKKMISQTNFAVSDNESRPVHTGALFETIGNQLTIVAVDGFRMAIRREIVENIENQEHSFVVPGTALSEVEKISSDNDGVVNITLGTKHIVFTIGDTMLISRRLEGEFLDYKNSIPSDGKYKIIIEKSEFIEAVERVSLIIGEKNKSPVRCVFGDGIVNLFSASALGKASDECIIEGDCEDLEIGFNDKYLLDALKAAPADELVMQLASGVAPCIMYPTDGSDSFLYMILPIRLKAYEN